LINEEAGKIVKGSLNRGPFRELRKALLFLVRKVRRLDRSAKRVLSVVLDVVATSLAVATAAVLSFGVVDAATELPAAIYAAAAGSTIVFFAMLGLYNAVVRFIGLRGVLVIGSGTALSTAVLIALNSMLDPPAVPPQFFAIYFMCNLLVIAASRVFARELLKLRSAEAMPVIIYGAGAAGALLCSTLLARRIFRPVALVDDNPALHGARLFGLSVCSSDRLHDLRRKYGTSLVLLAIPSATRRRRRDIIDRLTSTGLRVQTVPDIGEIVSGRSRIEEVRDIDVHDLLGRDPVPPNRALLGACIRGKSILVTGAGGSIGSELCRQIIPLAPRRLVLLEVSELALYDIERELRSLNARLDNRIELVALLGNAHHKSRVREIITTFGIQTIYHAAAYKHVPIVEHNMIEGIHNNIFATYNTAEAAMECRVETFVLISTDKAVNPTNVMGCTKRVSEMVLQGLHQRGNSTRFCMVRFGNVLESSGSVVPLFREQIREGGPVTVTHPDVIRYFMTIPEAAQLVIQAGSMGLGGDVFVLDMGSPVRIADLAKRMIQLAGYTVRDEQHPDGDIEVRFTGLRPAEKLFEELLIGKNVTGTEHPRILRAMEHSLSWEQIRHILDELSLCLSRFDCERAREILLRAVPEYQPTDKVQDHVWLNGGSRVSGAMLSDDEKVRELRPRPPA
jgi:FlaA1/EpsC-like NDP-sugar epimerase